MRSNKQLWRRTPPVIFPVSLGFMGLAHAWRGAATVLAIPPEIGDLLLGLSTAFMVFFLAMYVAKTVKRPRVVWEDMSSAHGRGGIATIPMSLMLLTAALLPFNVSVPEVWWAGVVLQVITILLSAATLIKSPATERRFSPFQYLSFVGPVIAPIAGVPLGFRTASFWLVMFALVAWVVISIGYGRRLLFARPPMPLRPSLAIVLAATSLMAIAFSLLGMPWAFHLFYWIAFGLALALLLSARWLAGNGWTPLWATFTFPIATFTNMQVVALQHGEGVVALAALMSGLAIGTPLILYIVYKSVMSFAKGEMAQLSGAARA
jgi:tellurite resistance protein